MKRADIVWIADLLGTLQKPRGVLLTKCGNRDMMITDSREIILRRFLLRNIKKIKIKRLYIKNIKEFTVVLIYNETIKHTKEESYECKIDIDRS